MHSSVNQELTPSGQEVGTFLSMSVLGLKSVHLPLARPVKVMIMIHVSLLCNGLGTFLPFFANKSGRRGAWGSKHSSLLHFSGGPSYSWCFCSGWSELYPTPTPPTPSHRGYKSHFIWALSGEQQELGTGDTTIYCINQHMGDQRCWS